MRRIIALASCLLLAGCALSPARTLIPAARRADEAGVEALPTHGLSIGEVTPHSAVVWARTDRATTLFATVTPEEGGPTLRASVDVAAGSDYAGQVRFGGLEPETVYRVWVWFDDATPVAEGSLSAQFHTAPRPGQPAPIRFAFGGDLGGQNVCRDAREGYPIFAALVDSEPDFAIGLGDMIYADGVCEARGRYGNEQVPGDFPSAARLADFFAHWRYNRADTRFQNLLAHTPYYAVWDDHEVSNDFGPETPLVAEGLRAFRAWNPIGPDARGPLHRRFRWGRHLELFLLDTRRYRDPNRAADAVAAPKSALGAAQRRWLVDGLAASDATWKVIATSVPLSIPTGSPAAERGRDGWANAGGRTGFEQELVEILEAMRDAEVANTLWITTDVHFATGFRYVPFPDSPEFETYELVTGPLSAGLFPKQELDPTLHPERLFFFGAESPDAVETWEAARRWFNFGLVEIESDGTLTLAVVDIRGKRVFEHRLTPR